MKKRLFFSIVAIFIISSFGGCYPSAYIQTASNERGIGGTGIDGDGRGIGGTGIIGTITEFGSIVVNGLNIEYRDDQVVSSLFEQKRGRDLRIGQVVEVFAKNDGNKLVAESISERVALAGKITGIDINSQTLTLNNLVVALPKISAIQDPLEVGLDVIISGHWLNGTLYSNYIENVSGKYGQLDEPIIGSSLIDIKDVGLGDATLVSGSENLLPETFVYSKLEGVDSNLVITDHIRPIARDSNLIFEEKIKREKHITSLSSVLTRYVIVSHKGLDKEVALGNAQKKGNPVSIGELKGIVVRNSLEKKRQNSNKTTSVPRSSNKGVSNKNLKTSNKSSGGGNSGGGNSGDGNSGGGNSGGGNSGDGNSGGGNSGGGNSGDGNSGGGNSGGGNSGDGNSGGGNSGDGNSGGGKDKK